jgi:hypothetical protein
MESSLSGHIHSKEMKKEIVMYDLIRVYEEQKKNYLKKRSKKNKTLA